VHLQYSQPNILSEEGNYLLTADVNIRQDRHYFEKNKQEGKKKKRRRRRKH
jgi:hypothetical protein